ncbi:hypothetical protein SLE2022_156900 [Rubroshorea leprosula]
MEENVSQQICIPIPPQVNSEGYWSNKTNTYIIINEYSLPKLELQIALILLTTQASHFLLKKLEIPIFISQIIAGMVIGFVLGKVIEEKYENMDVLGTMSAIGYGLFVFQSAVKTDLRIIWNSGVRPWCIGVLSLLLPICFTVKKIILLERTNLRQTNNPITHSICISLMFSMTSYPVVAMLLQELKILNSELGRLASSSALVSDLVGSTGFMVMAVTGILDKAKHVPPEEATYYTIIVASPIAIVIVAIFLLRPGLNWVVRNTPEDRPVNDFYVYGTLLLLLLAAPFTRFNVVFLIWFPFIIGLAVPEGPPMGSAVLSKFEGILNNLFVPICVATISMRFNMSSVDMRNDVIRLNTILCVGTLVIKFCVSLLLCRILYKMPIKDSISFALILNNRGLVDMGLYAFSFDSTSVNDGLYTAVSLVFLVMTTTGSVLVKLLYDPSKKYAAYQKRNIADLTHNSELQIVACIHIPNDVTPIIKLLDVTCPNKENPLAINVLHLVKLIGRSSSLFISHHKHHKTISELSYFENAVLLFYQFELSNWGAVSVNAFTAVSPPSSMYEDICNLALDKQSSLILLPFHQRWCPDGTIEFDDNDIRNLNSQILDMSPCSVGILLVRSTLSPSISQTSTSSIAQATSFNVAMVFLGGDDDREALIFAQRIAQDDNACLTVIVLKANTNTGMSEWDIMLDSIVLRDVKSIGGVKYLETVVEGGPETATVLRSVALEYDLVVAGRRNDLDSPQTLGLKEWSEFPEIGVIGDLLASTDLEGTCSILIIQQQKTKK